MFMFMFMFRAVSITLNSILLLSYSNTSGANLYMIAFALHSTIILIITHPYVFISFNP